MDQGQGKDHEEDPFVVIIVEKCLAAEIVQCMNIEVAEMG